MTITNPRSGTNVHEIAAGIYRIGTPILPTVDSTAIPVRGRSVWQGDGEALLCALADSLGA